MDNQTRRDMLKKIKNGEMSPDDGVRFFKGISDTHGESAQKSDKQSRTDRPVDSSRLDIAIIGMSGRFPGAHNKEQYWENLVAGKDSIISVPAPRWDIEDFYDPDPAQLDKTYCRYGGFLDDIDLFDASFFGMAGREAELSDPIQRIFLEESWNAFEDAGYATDELARFRCGVFVGVCQGDYQIRMHELGVPMEPQSFWGNAAAIVPARVSYFLNLKGPCMAVDTACSSSLVSMHLACQSLRAGECDMALAGGVLIWTTPSFYILSSNAGMIAPDGRCKSFDNAADGFGPGEGAGAVVLKRLEDALRDGDHIHGIIRASAINQDGKTNGITAPSVRSQTELEAGLYRTSGINPESIGYVETHGTGTILGDPIEVQALSAAFGEFTDKKQFCPIGSVKTNIGHAGIAAGIASVVKVLMSMRAKKIAASIHFHEPNQHIDFQTSPFYVNTELRDWIPNNEGVLRAAISSFGFSGTNAHMIIDSPPDLSPQEYDGTEPWYLVPFSARSESALARKIDDFCSWFALQGDDLTLRDISFSLLCCRKHFAYRNVIVVRNKSDLRIKLEALKDPDAAPDDSIVKGRASNKRPAAEAKARLEKLLVAVSGALDSSERQREAYLGLAEAYCAGNSADWTRIFRLGHCNRIPMPPYPFERDRYWIEGSVSADLPRTRGNLKKQENESCAELCLFAPRWIEVPAPRPGPAPSPEGSVLVFDDESDMVNELRQFKGIRGMRYIHVARGDRYKKNKDGFIINSACEEDYVRLVQDLRADGLRIHGAIFLWALGYNDQQLVPIENPSDDRIDSASRINELLQQSAYPLFFFCKAIGASAGPSLRRLLYVHPEASGLGAAVCDAPTALVKSLAMAFPEIAVTTLRLPADRGDRFTEYIADAYRRSDLFAKELSIINGTFYTRTMEETHPSSGPDVLRKGGVYLITGGAGGLGILFARHLLEKYQAHLVLAGRSALKGEHRRSFDELARLGTVVYHQADIVDEKQARDVVNIAREKFGVLNGVIHAAGVITETIITRKTFGEFKEVLAPKLQGTVSLDAATRDCDLDFFMMFSSSSAVLGDFGQCDYAIANRFMDAYAAYRSTLVGQGKRSGVTSSINWPLWKEGGMHRADQEEARYLSRSGLTYITREDGIAVLDCALRSGMIQLAPFKGDALRIRKIITPDDQLSQSVIDGDFLKAAPSGFQKRDTTVEVFLEKELIAMAASHLKIKPEKIDPLENMGDFGFDSIMLKSMAVAISKTFAIDVQPTVFFSNPSVQSLRDYLLDEHGPAIKSYHEADGGTGTSPGAVQYAKPIYNEPIVKSGTDMDIAIIGISCRFPGADSHQQFWENLKTGVDSITEIPPDRWDWRECYGDARKDRTKTTIKWGGFISGVDRFDAKFFKLSPHEVSMMDPQHRLFLETAWKTIEDAGYRASSLAGTNVGVFVGSQFNDYLELLGALDEPNPQIATGNSSAILANRVSYYFDFHGPSEFIDTACSSSLVAVHRAVRSLQSGECSLALAGGVSLMLSKKNFIVTAQLGVLSPDGRCKTFDAGANGYVRGEGVGAVLLKPLAQAIADNDHIYAVVKGSAENHGGRAQSLTAPNADAQAGLIMSAFARAGFAPETVTYVEAHGTGTELGDPVEVEALMQAFKALAPTGTFKLSGNCGLGSVKTNIGHLEPASGIAGIIKVALSMKHGVLPVSLHVKKLNPYIRIAGTPFYVNTTTRPWERLIDETGHAVERRAGISSFGFGGANAHVLLEEWQQSTAAGSAGPFIVVLSARESRRLDEYALSMSEYLRCLQPGCDVSLASIAWTLQIGREPMDERLALVVNSLDDLRDTLVAWCAGERTRTKVYRGNRGQGDRQTVVVNELIAQREYGRIAELWVAGAQIDWPLLYPGGLPPRVPLPTYPFARDRYWVPDMPRSTERAVRCATLHPLVHENRSTLKRQAFSASVSGRDFFMHDHRIGGRMILPGVAYIEMIRAAGELAGMDHVTCIRNVVWVQPLQAGNTEQGVEIELVPSPRGVRALVKGENGNGSVYAQALIDREAINEVRPSPYDLARIKGAMTGRLEAKAGYDIFSAAGLSYGPSFRVMEWLAYNDTSALARLALPDGLAASAADFVLHPSIMDGALQTVLALMSGSGARGGALYLPFELEKIVVHGPVRGACYAYSVYADESLGVRRFAITILDEAGAVLVEMKNFAIRQLTADTSNADGASGERFETVYYQEHWDPCDRCKDTKGAVPDIILVFDENDHLYNSIRDAHAGSTMIHVCPGDAFGGSGARFTINPDDSEEYHAVIRRIAEEGIVPGAIVFNESWGRTKNAAEERQVDCAPLYALTFLIQALHAAGLSLPVLIVADCANDSSRPSIAGSLAGFARTVMREMPRLPIRVLSMDGIARASAGAAVIYELSCMADREAFVLEKDDARFVHRLVSVDGQSAPAANSFRKGGVYCITGGAGGIGRILARYLARTYGARLVLAGRSAPNEQTDALLHEIKELGGSALYLCADISQYAGAQFCVDSAVKHFGALHGILHCAGVIEDARVLSKTLDSLDRVCAPKVAGTMNLDRATKGIDLDIFVLFSSGAAVIGNPGQSDYAYANAFMDAFVYWREKLFQAGLRRGSTLSINWPLWEEGGMTMDAAHRNYMKNTLGMVPLGAQEGIDALCRALASGQHRIAVFRGIPEKIAVFVTGAKEERAPRQKSRIVGNDAAILATLQKDLSGMVFDILKVPAADIDVDENMSEYGFDSISVTDFTNRINDRYCTSCTPAIFFEHASIASFAQFLMEKYHAEMTQYFGAVSEVQSSVQEPRTTPERFDGFDSSATDAHDRFLAQDNVLAAQQETGANPAVPIAIIGMDGVFPGAPGLDGFWKNLVQGNDCIREIPPDRWDWRSIYGDPRTEPNRTNITRGGFIEGVDLFDHRFFGISPREAVLMDPQQRLFLQTVWRTIENAGYRATALAGSRTGLFVGVGASDYRDVLREHVSEIDPYLSTGIAHSVLANRVSYLLDLRGPSEPVDTACSSSLVALHHAVQAIRVGECDLAIAGGISLMLSPEIFIAFSKAGMLSPDGRCKTFDKDANGYVRGEGVGAVLLKPLNRALEDGDHIWGVIRGTAVNHGGHVSSLTVPNPNAQAEVIIAAMEQAGVEPGSVSYIEAHGTGTKLGDPVEVNGLKKAYSALFEKAGKSELQSVRCAIGSVKTNIGHLETASGIAGLIKVLLAMKHEIIPASINLREINPYIELEGSRFVIAHKTMPWLRPSGFPLRAGLSSFGFGGTNVHLVLEEAPQTLKETREENEHPVIVPLSAKTGESLVAYATLLRNYFAAGPCDIVAAAYTLQIGRNEMEHRFAFVARNSAECVEKLNAFIAGSKDAKGLYRGQTKEKNSVYALLLDGTEGARYLTTLFTERRLDKVAMLWVAGIAVDWCLLYGGRFPGRIPLPAYSFARERVWISDNASRQSSAPARQQRRLHPLIDENISTVFEQRFTRVLSRNDFFVRDHVVGGDMVLPGAAYIEMARAAAELSGVTPVDIVENIVLAAPVVVKEAPCSLAVVLGQGRDNLSHVVRILGEEDKPHCQCSVRATGGSVYSGNAKDLQEIRKRCPIHLDGEECYRVFESVGLSYGPAFRVLSDLWYSDDEALGRCILPKSFAGTLAGFTMHPSILDGAFQSAMGLLIGDASHSRLMLPFSVGSVTIATPLPGECWSHVLRTPDSDGGDSVHFDIDVVDNAGNVLVKVRDYCIRKYREAESTTCFFAPQWKESPRQEVLSLSSGCLIVDRDEKLALDITRHYAGSRDACISMAQGVAGAAFENRSDARYIFDHEKEEEWIRLFDTLASNGQMTDCCIINLANLCPCDSLATDAVFMRTMHIAFNAARALIAGIHVKTRLIFVYHAETPEHAGIRGFARSLKKEADLVVPVCLEISPDGDMSFAVVAEKEHVSGDSVVRYVDGVRYCAEYGEASEIGQNAAAPVLRSSGVYCITGGAGGIGRIVARYLAEAYHARLVLTGRSVVSDDIRAFTDELGTIGGDARYVQCDVTDADEVRRLMDEIRETYGCINGIIHAAGLTSDAMLINKTVRDFERVLAPKVAGTVNLDAATSLDKLDFFVLFSSISSVLGSPGQTDYASANSFMDNFVLMREKLRASGHRSGFSLSINWPYWEQGGMSMDGQAVKLMARLSGMRPLSSVQGVEAFTRVLTSGYSQVMIASGQAEKIRSFVTERNSTRADAPAEQVPLSDAQRGALRDRLQQELIQSLARILSLTEDAIDGEDDLRDFGLDSIALTEFANWLNDTYELSITPDIFFDYHSVASFVDYIIASGQGNFAVPCSSCEKEHPVSEALPTASAKSIPRFSYKQKLSPLTDHGAPEADLEKIVKTEHEEPIAIIGISCVMPGSNNAEEFWQHLEAGDDLISEIPPDRWDWRRYYGDHETEPNVTRIHWGGFMEEVDMFDSDYFGISPREAELMDPQHRIFMQTVWQAIEDAGYRPSSLAGTNTGLFVGVASLDYNDVLRESGMPIEVHMATGNAHSILANRISYFLDIHGPSEPVDTACSSSLVAVHRALECIRRGDCDMAIAGGVNALLSPLIYIALSKGGMLSEDGRCKTFDAGANGYARGEGVGAIILKPLSKAERDGDHIYGILKGSAINHGGKANSLTAPNPELQAACIITACRRAGVEPESIGYIETHGTGTALGDPIEINGLKTAFFKLGALKNNTTQKKPWCWLGSVKTNIGHLETAAGIAGLIKVLLAFKNKKIPASLHCHTLNPYIKIEGSPFKVITQIQSWDALLDGAGRALPRRAGVSSFGFGGVNAHVVLEEYTRANAVADKGEEHLIILSARDNGLLRDYAARLREYLGSINPEELSLRDMAFTLQTGRDAMSERLCIVASSTKKLCADLDGFLHGDVSRVITGSARNAKKTARVSDGGPADQPILKSIIEKRDLPRLATLWVNGMDVDWHVLYQGKPAARLSLPTLPFERKRCWVASPNGKGISKLTARSIQRTARNEGIGSDESMVVTKTLKGDDRILRDHRVKGAKMLPGVCHIDMAIEVSSHLRAGIGMILESVVWQSPVLCPEEQVNIAVRIESQSNAYAFSIMRPDTEAVYSSGTVRYVSPDINKKNPLAIDELKDRLPRTVDSKVLYEGFKAGGIEYGPAFRPVRRVWTDGAEALGELVLPGEWGDLSDNYSVHPSIADGGLQVVACLMQDRGGTAVPFSIDRVESYAPLAARSYVHAVRIRDNCYDISFYDDRGNLLLCFIGAAFREIGSLDVGRYYVSRWIEEPLSRAAAGVLHRKDHVFGHNTLMVYPSGQADVAERLRAVLGAEKTFSIVLGSENRDWKNGLCEVDAAERHALQSMLSRIDAPDAVYFIGNEPGDYRHLDSLEQFDNRELTGVTSLFRLVKALVSLGMASQPLVLKIMTLGVYDIDKKGLTNPVDAALCGLTRALIKEFPVWEVSCVDLGVNTHGFDSDGFAGLVEAFVEEPRQNGETVALYSGTRYVRKVYPFVMPQTAQSPFRQGGVYVIIGGAGGIGLVLARFLALDVHAKVALIGRSALSEEKITEIEEINVQGGSVLYVQADTVDEESLRKARMTINGSFGAVNGVIHSAMVLRDAPIKDMSEEDFYAALLPKTRGSVVMARVFREEPLDFTFLFSSVISIFGGQEQGNYVAGCAFEDAFGPYLTQSTGRPSHVVNWGFWGTVGAVSDESHRRWIESQGFFSLTPEEGMEAISRMISGGVAQAIVQKGEARTLRSMGIDFSCEARSAVDKHSPSRLVIPNVVGLSSDERSRLDRLREGHERFTRYGRHRLLEFFRAASLFCSSSEKHTRREIFDMLKAKASYEKLIDAFLLILNDEGLISLEGEVVKGCAPLDGDEIKRGIADLRDTGRSIAADFPELQAQVELLDRCVASYAAILAGDILATDVIFPQSSMELVERIYAANPVAEYFNDLLADCVCAQIADTLEGDSMPVKIIEVGAGTGGTSKNVLGKLADMHRAIDYCYTDISRVFLEYGRKKFGGQYPWVRYSVLDIEKDLDTQGILPGEFDLVIAANVLHATSKIGNTLGKVKALLKNQGVLIINEVTAVHDFSTMTFGLLDGWWLFDDGHKRLPGSPLLGPSQWERELAVQGFSDIRIVEQGDGEGTVGQSIIAAQSDGAFLIEKKEKASRLTRVGNGKKTGKLEGGAAQHPKTSLVEAVILELLGAVLHRDPEQFDPEVPYADFGVDSILAIELVRAVNERLKITIRTVELFNFTTIRELAAYVAEEYESVLDKENMNQGSATESAMASTGANGYYIEGLSMSYETNDENVARFFPSQKAIGKAGGFPHDSLSGTGADSIEVLGGGVTSPLTFHMREYWDNLEKRKEGLVNGAFMVRDFLHMKTRDIRSLTHLRVPVGGISLEVVTAGAGEPLLMIPGFGITAPASYYQFEAWASSYQLVVIHMPGHGSSDDTNNLSLENISRAFAHVLDMLGIERPLHVLGASFGGVVAQQFAHDFSDRVATLTLCASFSVIDLKGVPLFSLKNSARIDFDKALAHTGQGEFKQNHQIYFDLLLKSECINPRTALKYIDEFSRTVSTEALHQGISMPTHLVHGAIDTMIPLAESEKLVKRIPGAVLTIMDGAGHFPSLTHHREFNNIVMQFIQQHPPGD